MLLTEKNHVLQYRVAHLTHLFLRQRLRRGPLSQRALQAILQLERAQKLPCHLRDLEETNGGRYRSPHFMTDSIRHHVWPSKEKLTLLHRGAKPSPPLYIELDISQTYLLQENPLGEI